MQYLPQIVQIFARHVEALLHMYENWLQGYSQLYIISTGYAINVL